MLRAPVASPPDCTKEKRWSAVNCRDAFRAKTVAVAVGMPVARHPPHKTARAYFTHAASTLDNWRRSVRAGGDAEHVRGEAIWSGCGSTAPAISSLVDCAAQERAATAGRADSERSQAEVSCREQHGIGNNPTSPCTAKHRPTVTAHGGGGAAPF